MWWISAILGGCLLAVPAPTTAMEDEDVEDGLNAVSLQYQHGLELLKGLNGHQPDPNQGLQVLKEAADKGSGEAAYEVGAYYESGGEDGGAGIDVESAFEWYSKAAANGHPEGQSALAFMHETGIGAERDEAKATLYHYFASTGGSIASLMSLGYKHMYGLGVPKSCDTAFSYYNPVCTELRLVTAASAKPPSYTHL